MYIMYMYYYIPVVGAKYVSERPEHRPPEVPVADTNLQKRR